MKSVIVEIFEGSEKKWILRTALILVVNYILFCANSDISDEYYHLFWSNAIIMWFVMLIFIPRVVGATDIAEFYILYKGNDMTARRLMLRVGILTCFYVLIMIISSVINTVIGIVAFDKMLYIGRLDINALAFTVFVISLYVLILLKTVQTVKGKGFVGVVNYIVVFAMYVITFAAELTTLTDKNPHAHVNVRDDVIGIVVIIVYVIYAVFLYRRLSWKIRGEKRR